MRVFFGGFKVFRFVHKKTKKCGFHIIFASMAVCGRLCGCVFGCGCGCTGMWGGADMLGPELGLWCMCSFGHGIQYGDWERLGARHACSVCEATYAMHAM